MVSVEAERNAIYQYIQGVLKNTSKTESSSIPVGGVVDAVRLLVDDACADFAQEWNHQKSIAGVAGVLAAEILTSCFHLIDFEWLIQATHICRRWRDLALANCTLWASFRQPRDQRGKYDAGQAVRQISVMLDRSRPAPFTLRLQLAAWSPKHALSLGNVLHRDVWRLRSFVGPFDLYLHIVAPLAAVTDS